MAVLRVPNPQLPWTATRGEDSRFQSILLALFAAYVAIALVITLVKLPPLMAPEPRLAPPATQVVLQRIELPKPPQPVAPPKPLAPPQPVERTAAPRPQPVPPKPQPREREIVAPSKGAAPGRAGGGGKAGGREAPIELTEQARANAAKAGVLQFRDDLAEMRETIDVAKVTRSNLTRGNDTAEKTERALITGRATGGSGGINTAALSTNTGGIALSGRDTTRIDSPAGSGGRSGEGGGRGRGEGSGSGTGTGNGRGTGSGGKQGDLVGGGGGSGGRSDEAIRRMMDQQKGGIFAIYNRALRQDPGLQGKFVFEMVIEPDGSVSDAKLVSSELNDGELTGKILARIRMINFGAANVLRTRVNYSLDFLPSG